MTTTLGPDDFELYRCKVCKCLWRLWHGDGGWSLAPGESCGKCCDMEPMTPDLLEPVSSLDEVPE